MNNTKASSPTRFESSLTTMSARRLISMYFNGRLEEILPQIPPQSILALASRPDFQLNYMVKKVVDLAAGGNQSARECLDNLSKTWNDDRLEIFANNNILKYILDNLSPKAALRLFEQAESYNDHNFSGPYDLLAVHVRQLARNGNPDANALLNQHALDWDNEYFDHLAQYNQLEAFLVNLNPSTLIRLANNSSFSRIRNRLTFMLISLAEAGNKEVKEYFSALLETSEYVLWFSKLGLLDRIFIALEYSKPVQRPDQKQK